MVQQLKFFNEEYSGAVIDETKMYRYSLWRVWDENKPRLLFIMLNPSTADEVYNDPTITRCIGYAKKWGYGSTEVVNLFAYRSTDPVELMRAENPIGPDNDSYINKSAEGAGMIIAAWGNHGILNNRHMEVISMLNRYVLHCLGKNKSGQPKHPLYMSSGALPMQYR